MIAERKGFSLTLSVACVIFLISIIWPIKVYLFWLIKMTFHIIDNYAAIKKILFFALIISIPFASIMYGLVYANAFIPILRKKEKTKKIGKVTQLAIIIFSILFIIYNLICLHTYLNPANHFIQLSWQV